MSFHVRVLAGSLTPTAGSHIYNRELIRRLSERGHRVSVVCLDDGGDDWGPVDATVLPRRDWNAIPGAWRFAVPLQAARSRMQVAGARLDRPDVVIAAEHLFLKAHARRFPNVPWLYLPHSLVVAHEIDSYGMMGLQRRLTRNFYVRQQRWALRHAAGVVRFNQFAATALCEHYGSESIRAPFVINPPGIELHDDDVESLRRCKESLRRTGLPTRPDGSGDPSYATSRAPLRMLFVGRLVPSKNLEFVLRCLAAHREAAWTLDIVGDGPERTRCEAAAGECGLSHRVRFHGHQSDPARWYRKADLLVFPSKLESMGLVVLEAMAHGLPAIAIREDGVNYRGPFSEVIDDGSNGLLSRDESDFARRLAAAIFDPDIVEPLRASARAAVRARYVWDCHLERFEGEFARLAGPPRCGAQRSSFATA